MVAPLQANGRPVRYTLESMELSDIRPADGANVIELDAIAPWLSKMSGADALDQIYRLSGEHGLSVQAAKPQVVQAQEGDDGRRRYIFKSSDSAINRRGDRVMTKGIDIEAYKENPLILWMHWAPAVVGQAPETHKAGDDLIAPVIFDEDEDDYCATQVRRKVDGQSIRAMSTGLRVLEALEVVEDGKRRGFDLMRTELLEQSIVSIPAHAGAVRKMAMAYKAGNAGALGDLLEPCLAEGLTPVPSERLEAFAQAFDLETSRLLTGDMSELLDHIRHALEPEPKPQPIRYELLARLAMHECGRWGRPEEKLTDEEAALVASQGWQTLRVAGVAAPESKLSALVAVAGDSLAPMAEHVAAMESAAAPKTIRLSHDSKNLIRSTLEEKLQEFVEAYEALTGLPIVPKE